MSFLVRRVRSSWLLLACVAVTVLLATGLMTVLWAFAAQTAPAGALSILASPQGRLIALNGLANAGQAASDSQFIRATLRKAWPGVGFQMESALWADPIQLPSLATNASTPPASSLNEPTPTASASVQIQPAFLDGFSAHATLTAGTWPSPPHRRGLLPVALPVAVASRLHLAPGSVLTGTLSGGTPTSLQVTGLFRPRNPASPYWALDMLPVSGIFVQGHSITYAGLAIDRASISYGPALVNPAAFGGALGASQASWLVLPTASSMARGNIGELATSTNAAVSKLATSILPYGLQVTSGLPQLLTGIGSTIVLTRSLFAIAALQLLLVAGAGLVLATRLLASLREEESALLRARGATRWEVARPALAEAVVLGTAAGLAGVLIGTRLTGVADGLVKLHLASYPAVGITPLAWWSALATLVLCAAVMAWPALHAVTPDAARIRQGRQARIAMIAWAGGDLAVVTLAALSVWELRGYSAVAHPVTGSLGIDPVVAVAPVLAVAGVALIPLRGLPLLARVADKATERGRRLAAAMASWQVARRPIRQAGPALLVVVATATTTLALAGYASWRQSTQDQAAFAVGSDVRVDSASALPLGTESAISRAPGVTAATPASVTGIGNGAQMIALNASAAHKAVLLRPDLSPLPLSTLWQRITPRQSAGLALPGQPARLGILAALGAGPRTSAATLPQELGPVTVKAWIQDAGGATYEIQAASFPPADGQPHRLVFALSDPGQASYPLRLLGLTLTYQLPPYDPASPRSVPAANLRIESLSAAGTASGPFGRPFSHGVALAAWPRTAFSAWVPTGPPDVFGGYPPSGGAAPAILGWHRAAGGGRQLTFNAGHLPSTSVILGLSLNPGLMTGEIGITAPPPSQVVPAIATDGYLSASRLRIGSTIPVSLNGFSITVRIVASVARFPTVFGPNRALIADLAEVSDLAEFSNLLAANPVSPALPVTRWWLRTVDGRVPPMPPGLGLSVTDRVAQQQALINNALLTAPRQALLVIGVAAVLLSVLGFSISVAASLRSRRTQSAVFAALGVGKNAQAGQLCLEQCGLSIPAAAVGLLAGIGLAHLLVPAITLTSGAVIAVPPALVVMPLGPAVALALVAAAVPAAAAALSVMRRPDPAAQLRMEAR